MKSGNSKLAKEIVNHREQEGCCNAKCIFAKGELSAMRQQVLDLNQTIASLENAFRIKDAQYNEAQRMYELLLVELKKKSRSSHMFKQKLEEEKFLCQSQKSDWHSINGGCDRCCNDIERKYVAMKAQLIAKTQATYDLAKDLFQTKRAKDALKRKLDLKSEHHIRMIAEILEKLDETGRELNTIVSSQFREPLPASKAKFLQIVQRNARLVFENAALKAQLEKSIENVKETQKYRDRSSERHRKWQTIINRMVDTGREGTTKYSKWPSFV